MNIYMGRRRIFSRFDEVNENNVVNILNEALPIHTANVSEMLYLWNYYRGRQPILDREKKVRADICNRVVENHAQEVVSFKTGYQLSEPIQYICRTSDGIGENSLAKEIANLNTLMFAENAEPKNRDLFEWMCVCGIGYKFVEPDVDDKKHGEGDAFEEGGAPFAIHIPEPWSTFIVYSSKYHHRPIMGVWVAEMDDGIAVYTVYTPKMVYTIQADKLVSSSLNGTGHIPIIEYDLNNSMMGVFEAALPILDAINNLESNRIDGVEQIIQALYLFKNCQIDKDGFLEMLSLGAIRISSTEGVAGDVSLITNDVDQTGTQTIKDDLYQALVNICGMPNRNQGGANDTGSAVLLRDGWTLAESHAKSYELQFKRSERNFLRVILRICSMAGENLGLKLRDIDLAFNRRNYDNILTKSQVLTTMLSTGKVDPLDCFKACGLFTDPSAAYLRSTAFIKEQEEKAKKEAEEAFLQQQQKQEEDLVDHDGDGIVGEDNHGRTD